MEPTNYTGSVDFEDEDVLSLDDEYVQAKIAFQKAQASADALRERQHALAKQMEEDEQNLIILLEDRDNIAGEVSRRLQHIITAKGWERTALAQASGIGRTTLYRYLLSPGDERYQVTKKKNLLKILDVLSVSVHAFCVFPDDFETWRKSFDQTPVNGLSLFDWRDEVLCVLQTNTFVYKQNGHNVRMPQAQFEMFKNAIEGILGMLDMIPHDTCNNQPKWMRPAKK